MSPTFGFYMHVRKPKGSDGAQQFFYCMGGSGGVVIFVDWRPETVPTEVLAEYKKDLYAVLGRSFNPRKSEASVPLAAIGENLEAFKDVIRKLQRRVDPDAAGGA